MRDRRHYFARIRTQLANERTLMAYLRGALAMFGISAFLFKFFASLLFNILSGAFLLSSIILFVYGLRRYFHFKKKTLKK